MSNQQGKWREEQILVICPGSQTTMAGLGVGELVTPPHRIPTRMFKDAGTNQYRPFHTYKRKKADVPDDASDADKYEWVEDRDSSEGAVYPIVGGRIVNIAAFLAFLEHVHGLLTTTYHNTPIVLVASPSWTRGDLERITSYVFEKTKTPALCIMHSGLAAEYGTKWPNITVIDIGFETVHVTCIYEYNIVNEQALGLPCSTVTSNHRDISGGEMLTQKLYSLLKDQGFTYEMAEELKKSPICEVLPYAPRHQPYEMELPTEDVAAPSAGQGDAPAAAPTGDAAKIVDPSKPAPAWSGEEEGENAGEGKGDEGVLNVADIVTSGNTRDFLAKREKEKAEKAKSKKPGKAQEAEPGSAKLARIPNSKRTHNTFHYEILVHEDVEVPVAGDKPKANGTAATDGAIPATAEGQSTDGEVKTEPKAEPKADAIGEPNGENAKSAESAESGKTTTERHAKRVRKDIEVGLERFLFADPIQIDRIVDCIYRTIQGIPDMYKRPACWDNLLFVGNGSRMRGLKDRILGTLNARYLISPSSATMFTSELPSNLATPSGTGSQTPTSSYAGNLPPGQLPLPTSSTVNPLLQAATTASLGVPGQAQAPGSAAGDGGAGHHTHGQTPMSIKLAPLPGYLAEWTKNGFEECQFLGGMIGGRMAYTHHNPDHESQRQLSVNRVEYNETGPKAVRLNNLMGKGV
ncbi:hypothetical protein F4780DRAFT_737747 [Xylariomycetidae sp. FL0641]|nr:hypothetical protein F4780DRAFT_737747 [Xylariomycetidae sp. FL0641]